MSDNDSRQEDKKVDEGWKQKVREEREVLEKEAEKREKADREPSEEKESEAADTAPEKEAVSESRGELPPPTFTAFASSLASQAFMMLGLVENPLTGRTDKDLDAAKHLLDTLGMLEEKTRGNLTPQEASYLEELLYTLRMAYVKEAG